MMTSDREDLFFGLHLISGTNLALQPVKTFFRRFLMSDSTFPVVVCPLPPPNLNWSPIKFRVPPSSTKNPKSVCDYLFFGLHQCDLCFGPPHPTQNPVYALVVQYVSSFCETTADTVETNMYKKYVPSKAGGLRFESRAGQVEYSVLPKTQHFFYRSSVVCMSNDPEMGNANLLQASA